MTRLITRLLAVLLVPALLAGPTVASARPPVAVVDQIAFRHLPAGLGTTTDFTYDYDDVDFKARVWESRSHDGGWRVDLDIDVMRGSRLSSGRALHDWFIAYEERDPAEAVYHPVRVHGRPGWLCRDQLFWLVRPGLAVSVHLDRERWTRREVVRTARSARKQP